MGHSWLLNSGVFRSVHQERGIIVFILFEPRVALCILPASSSGFLYWALPVGGGMCIGEQDSNFSSILSGRMTLSELLTPHATCL